MAHVVVHPSMQHTLPSVFKTDGNAAAARVCRRDHPPPSVSAVQMTEQTIKLNS